MSAVIKAPLLVKDEGAISVMFPHSASLLPTKQQIFAAACFLVLPPNKVT